MKEKIYTIAVNEAFDAECSCPLCYLYQGIECKTVDFIMGPSMMEPEFRIKSNADGFCEKHYGQMLHKNNVLSLALMLDTHLNEIMEKMERLSSFHKKKEKNPLLQEFDRMDNACVVCEKIQDTMEKYIDVLFYLYKTEPEFKEKFLNTRGFCIHHFTELLDKSYDYLGKSLCEAFIADMTELEKRELIGLKEDIHFFTTKFDYRNQDKPWGTAKDAPVRTIEKINGKLY